MKLITILLTVLIVAGCKSQTTMRSYDYERYNEARNYFSPGFTDHFPDSLSNTGYSVNYSLDVENNNLECSLYDYAISNDSIVALVKRLEKRNILGKYDSESPCLLIVNRFQEYDPKVGIVIGDIDSAIVDQACFSGLYPIPNFSKYRYSKKKSGLRLPKGFTIYVLEAGQGTTFSEFNPAPDPEMPATWKNGYSKGIAINEKKRTVIYWSIVW